MHSETFTSRVLMLGRSFTTLYISLSSNHLMEPVHFHPPLPHGSGKFSPLRRRVPVAPKRSAVSTACEQCRQRKCRVFAVRTNHETKSLTCPISATAHGHSALPVSPTHESAYIPQVPWDRDKPLGRELTNLRVKFTILRRPATHSVLWSKLCKSKSKARHRRYSSALERVQPLTSLYNIFRAVMFFYKAM